jgi:hypothetical protein
MTMRMNITIMLVEMVMMVTVAAKVVMMGGDCCSDI